MQLAKYLIEEFKKASTITKGVVVGIILLIIFLIMASVHADKEEQERLSREAQAAAAANAAVHPKEEIDIDAELQAAYRSMWGEPPVGFKWQADGSLIALSDNATTAEDTAWYFLRGLSILDFSTAEKYNLSSTVVSAYDNFYQTEDSLNYYTQFIRKMYKQSLTSIEINKIIDSAVFADGDRVVTFSINILDLTNKDFWLDDADTIFATLYEYYGTENDGTKASQYLYDYVLNYYMSGNAKKRTVQIDLRLEKQVDGGWLVSDDMDLHMLCAYEYGVNAVEYIQSAYDAWVTEQYSNGAFEDPNELLTIESEEVDNPYAVPDEEEGQEQSDESSEEESTESESSDTTQEGTTSTDGTPTIDFNNMSEEDIKKAMENATVPNDKSNSSGALENGMEPAPLN